MGGGRRLFVAEFITGGGLAGATLPESLAEEGELMLRALVADLLAAGGVQLTVARDARLRPPEGPLELLWVERGYEALWQRGIEAADAACIIAPEGGGVLAWWNRAVLERGKVLLGCTPRAVALAASKLATSRALAAAGIPVADTIALGQGLPASEEGWVVKPDDGAGSEETYFFAEAESLGSFEPPGGNFVVQPYLEGRALSLTLLCTGQGVRALACNEQLVSRRGGRLRQTGVVVNGAAGKLAALQPLAEAIWRAIPGLRGYAGVDLIETAAGPVVLEVNPRLTTSYVGLSRSLGVNAAALMLDAFAGLAGVLTRPLKARPVRVVAHGHLAEGAETAP